VRVVRRIVAELRVRDVHLVRGAARVDQGVVVRALDVPVRMLAAQRVDARDAVRHDFEHHAQAVTVRELREPREGFERAGARRERRGRPVEIGDVTRKARGAGGQKLPISTWSKPIPAMCANVAGHASSGPTRRASQK
jgi:hypothetical protein